MTMSQLIAQGFSAGTSIQAKARAYNNKGWSPISPVSNSDILVQVVPQSPENLSITNVDATTLSLTWDALTDSSKLGYSSLTEYKLYWNTGVWQHLHVPEISWN